MYRRACLAAVTSLSAGCMGGIVDSPATRPLEVREVRVSSPDESRFEINAGLGRATISTDGTAIIEFVVTWSGDETIRLAKQIPFGGSPKFSESPKGLLLYHTEELPERRDSTSWVPKTVESNQADGSQPISPGQSISSTWSVWANPTHMSRIQPGDYQFDHRIGGDNSTESYEWNCTVSIREQ